jgi:hypothetical protein
MSVAGLVPWRCEVCELRFYARAFPLQHHYYAHCRRCGNLDLKRIAPEFVPGSMAWAGKLLHLPAMRCEPCRNKFFTLRPLWQGESDRQIAGSRSD